jgi:hypothetical protein
MGLLLSCLLGRPAAELELQISPNSERSPTFCPGELEGRSPLTARSDWEVDIHQTKPQRLAASELRRLVDYLEHTRELYAFTGSSEANRSESFQFLHLDLRQVIETSLFLPRVAAAENSGPIRDRPFGGTYRRLKNLRQRIYHLLLRLQTLARGDPQRRFVMELIFTNGLLDCVEVELHCPPGCSCSKLQLEDSSSKYWEIVSYQLGRAVSPSPSSEGSMVDEQPLQDILRVFSVILLDELGGREDSSTPPNMLAILLSVAFTITLTASWPETFGTGDPTALPEALDPSMWDIWAMVEIVFQHVDYVVGLANYFGNQRTPHLRSVASIRYLNRQLFGRILSRCLEQQLPPAQSEQSDAIFEKSWMVLEQIFALYRCRHEAHLKDAWQLCHRTVRFLLTPFATERGREID